MHLITCSVNTPTIKRAEKIVLTNLEECFMAYSFIINMQFVRFFITRPIIEIQKIS